MKKLIMMYQLLLLFYALGSFASRTQWILTRQNYILMYLQFLMLKNILRIVLKISKHCWIQNSISTYVCNVFLLILLLQYVLLLQLLNEL